MKTRIIGLVAAGMAFASLSAVAQEHWTEGAVWECSAYRTSPGQFDNYLNYIRKNVEPQNEAAKKQGLVLDYRTFVHTPRDQNDHDILFCTLYPSFGKALDYSKDDEAKADAIASKHYATADEEKQREMAAPRLEMRTFMGTSYHREVTLRPAK